MRVSALFICGLVLLTGCVDTSDPNTFGTLQAELTTGGKPAGNAQKVVVTLVKITAHSSTAGWVTLSSEKQTVDLTSFAEDAIKLGAAKMPAGKITQLRLYTAESGPHYVELKSGQRVELKVPSGLQSGIKVKGGLDLGPCQKATATVLMDADKSLEVHPTGTGDEWILRPVIKLANAAAKDIACPGDADSPADPTIPSDKLDGPGTACANGSTCLSGACMNGTCAQSDNDGPCSATSSCGAGFNCVEGSCAPQIN